MSQQQAYLGTFPHDCIGHLPQRIDGFPIPPWSCCKHWHMPYLVGRNQTCLNQTFSCILGQAIKVNILTLQNAYLMPKEKYTYIALCQQIVLTIRCAQRVFCNIGPGLLSPRAMWCDIRNTVVGSIPVLVFICPSLLDMYHYCFEMSSLFTKFQHVSYLVVNCINFMNRC